MSRPTSIHQIKSSRDFEYVTERQGCSLRDVGGHTVAKNQRGSCACPRNRKELCIGTLKAIVRTLAYMGLTVLAVVPFL